MPSYGVIFPTLTPAPRNPLFPLYIRVIIACIIGVYVGVMQTTQTSQSESVIIYHIPSLMMTGIDRFGGTFWNILEDTVYAIRINSKAFKKNCRDVRPEGRIFDWVVIQNASEMAVKEMDYSLFPWTGKSVFRVYQYGVREPEYWLVGE